MLKTFLQALVAAVIVMGLAVFAAMQLTGAARAEEPAPPESFEVPPLPEDMPQPPVGYSICDPRQGLCVIRADEYNTMRAIVAVAPMRVAQLQAELERLRKIKGCAKLEVEPAPAKPKANPKRLAPAGRDS